MKDVKATYAFSKNARVAFRQGTLDLPLLTRLDRILFDSQPEFEVHAALDFKYPLYKAHHVNVQTTCFYKDAAVASLIVQAKVLCCFLLH